MPELVTVESSADADIEMVDSPAQSSATPTATVMTSLFQTHSTAIRATIWFGALRVRANTVAILNSIAWGTPVLT
jgi:hypothetical protein